MPFTPRSHRSAVLLFVGAAVSFLAANPSGAQTNEATTIALRDVSAESGVDFVHFAGKTALKEMPETMGGGHAWLDYDADGFWDLYFVDSGRLSDAPLLRSAASESGANVMFRGGQNGRFRRAEAGAGDRGYGMGVAVADFDGDGFSDVFLANYGADALYRNNGDGTFSDASERLPSDDLWGTSATWGDLDLDGFPELFVTNYLEFEVPNGRACGDVVNDRRGYCQPELFDGQPDRLYQNLGGESFADISAAAGVDNSHEGKGLGVVLTDIDRDGLPDIYVANDGTRNFLHRNQGQLRFLDEGLISGAGLSIEGLPQSGMGVDAGDLDGDGYPEIAVTNYTMQPVNMYSPVAPGMYLDETFDSGLGSATAPTLGFGVVFVDLDGDGDGDVVVANGHALDTVADAEQPNQVFRNRRIEAMNPAGAQGRLTLEDVTATSGVAMTRRRMSRGVATGDYDGDGRPDLTVTNLDGPAELLHNDARNEANWLVVRLRGRASQRDGFGAQLRVRAPLGPAGEMVDQYFEVKSSSSYLSQGAADLYVGLGAAVAAEMQIRWPGGTVEDLGSVAAGQLVLIHEGRGLVAAQPLRTP